MTELKRQVVLADQQIFHQDYAEVIEMDELYSFAGTKQAVPESDDDHIGRHWIHRSMARKSRLLLALGVAPWTLEIAKTLVKNTAYIEDYLLRSNRKNTVSQFVAF